MSLSVSEIGSVFLKFRELEQDALEQRKCDVYSKNYVPKRFSKMSKEYGTPKPGTLTEMRAKKASKHIAKEMLYLCEVIQENGYTNEETGNAEITFENLFKIYTFISDKVVGILLRARKHKMVDFEGEMLYQRRDEAKIISLLLSPAELQTAMINLKNPAN
uniref:Costars domain-containing protein n=1 Tax=Panagrellus redivivus TaxID=6233 RepID=A0A7E4VQT1_PANRE